MFRVGMKVECVEEYSEIYLGKHPAVDRGKIYEVVSVGHRAWTDGSEAICVNACPYPLYARRFRPVVERKTDISIFNQILRDVTARESVRA